MKAAPSVPSGFDRRHCAVQAGIGLLINAALSLAFAMAEAHGRQVLPLWGAGGMAFGFVPQIFMTVFATTVAVTLVTRKALRAGRLAPSPQRGPVRLPRSALARALLLALCGAVVLTPLAIGAVALAGLTALAAPSFIALKVAFGGALGAIVAAAAARWALAAAD